MIHASHTLGNSSPDSPLACRLVQEFAASELLPRLRERHSLESLLAPPLRAPLLAYLQLEKRCMRWYSIACHFFRAAAAELAAQLEGDGDGGAQGAGGACGDAAAPGPAAAAAAAAADGQSPPSKRRRKPPGQPAVAEDSAVQAPPLPAIGEEQAAVLAVALECRRSVVEAAVYAMPSGSGVEVPALFSEAVPQGAQPDCLEIDSDTDADAEPRQEQAQQQQPQPPAT
jgi:hypothetical protein